MLGAQREDSAAEDNSFEERLEPDTGDGNFTRYCLIFVEKVTRLASEGSGERLIRAAKEPITRRCGACVSGHLLEVTASGKVQGFH